MRTCLANCYYLLNHCSFNDALRRICVCFVSTVLAIVSELCTTSMNVPEWSPVHSLPTYHRTDPNSEFVQQRKQVLAVYLRQLLEVRGCVCVSGCVDMQSRPVLELRSNAGVTFTRHLTYPQVNQTLSNSPMFMSYFDMEVS